jgi:acid phosphatase type 7
MTIGRTGKPRIPAATAQLAPQAAGWHLTEPQPLPPPNGSAPFRVDIATIVAGTAPANELIIHTVGDTGGVKNPQDQQIVADWMTHDAQASGAVLFYHLGDVLYYNGDESVAYDQFYEPYVHYPNPIVAIPGNHDGDVVDKSKPLAGFLDQFCQPTPVHQPEAAEVPRDAMTQPNVYWTLTSPLAWIIGLYSNVPEGGLINADQAAWLAQEFAATPRGVALIVAVHHPVYSADAYHAGSPVIAAVLDTAAATAGRKPDLVLTGHVHNYQRFTRQDGGTYVVAGAGGYWHLHAMAQGTVVGNVYGDATLQAYTADRHGFLRLKILPGEIQGSYHSVPRSQESWSDPAGFVEVDTFTQPFATA